MNQEFMKKKPILPLVISMALPMTISMLVNALYNIVDGYFVAKISEDAMTALSLVFPLQNVLTAITVGFGIGINAVVAFYLGANDKKNADTAASLGMFFNIIHGVVLTVLFLTTIPVFLKLFTGNKDVISSGMQYSYVVFSFCIPVSISMTFEKTFQAVGRMKVSMICMMAGCVTNIILDPLFIFGAGFIPAMGIKGAAIATVTGQCVTLLAYFLFYTFSSVPVRFSLKELHFDGKICKKLIHRLVAEHFLDDWNAAKEVNHKDGNKHNNRSDNLEMCTRQENVMHSMVHKLRDDYGENSVNAKLTNEQADHIRRLHRSGVMQNELAEQFKVCKQTICDIVHYKKYKK